MARPRKRAENLTNVPYGFRTTEIEAVWIDKALEKAKKECNSPFFRDAHLHIIKRYLDSNNT